MLAPTHIASESVVLALNSGSSSLKFGLYRVGPTKADLLLTGEAEAIGEEGSQFHAQDLRNHARLVETSPIPTQREAIARIGKFLDESGAPAPVAIGHRVVHGGPKLRQHCLIDGQVMQQLDAASAFAPLHTPVALSVMRFARKHFPALPQIACFDTTFHIDLPDVPGCSIPREWQAEGIQRYGFHGLSCESIVHQLGGDTPARLIIAHLGNGASITAIRDGKSIDTSMGMTPSGGLVMGTRSGEIDPGVLIYLMREKKLDAAKLEDMIDHRSGLLGISGISSDMRRLHEAASTNADARLAIDMFCYSVRKQIAAMIAVLGGVDLIVFTGGIGENDSEVRGAICRGLDWAGVFIEDKRDNLSKPRCRVQVLPSQEDEQIARHTCALALRGV